MVAPPGHGPATARVRPIQDPPSLVEVATVIVRRLARPLLASIFVKGGIDTLMNPAPRVQMATPLLDKVGESLPEQAPSDPGQLVRIDAGVKIGAGVLLALGKFPRVTSLLLAGTLVPTTVVGHPFWEKSDPAEKASDQQQFLKNLSILGGLILASVDTAGKPSLGWRGRRAAQKLADQTRDLTGSSSGAGDGVRQVAGSAATTVRDGVDIAIGRLAG